MMLNDGITASGIKFKQRYS